MNVELRLLFDKLPMFDPSWPDEWRANWLEAFERLLYIGDDRRRARLAAIQLRTIPALLPVDLSSSLREDVFQEIAVWLLERTYPRVDLPELVRTTVRRVRREYDLRYRTVSLDAPTGYGGSTFADLLEG